MDKGPWQVTRPDPYRAKGWAVTSDDFEHDVWLKISGDFESDEQGKAYAEWLCYALNMASQHVDAFQWTGDLDALEAWCGQRWPVSFNEVLSYPTGERGRYLRVWCGSWIIRHGSRAWAIPDDLKCLLFDLFRSDPPHTVGNG